ncbi:MAG: hypothetical protein K0S24_233 [Sphingobacterium sp.]|jgi:hypothetical protein|nr:hypothetical protein [Sphingobacterium sp.]
MCILIAIRLSRIASKLYIALFVREYLLLRGKPLFSFLQIRFAIIRA